MFYNEKKAHKKKTENISVTEIQSFFFNYFLLLITIVCDTEVVLLLVTGSLRTLKGAAAGVEVDMSQLNGSLSASVTVSV